MSNQPRFEVFPEMVKIPDVEISYGKRRRPSGNFVWHFKDANGKITFTGGEGFTRREDAHRSIRGVTYDIFGALEGHSPGPKRRALMDRLLPILDLDENGEVIAS